MNLTTTALVAKLEFTTLGNSRKDPTLTREVHANHDMEQDAGRYQKALLPDRCIAPLRTIMSGARSDYRKLTLLTPLGHLLPAAKAADFTEAMTKWRGTWDGAVRRFIADYDRNLLLAQRIHKATFDPALYPTKAELPDKFKMEFTLIPLPRAEMLDEIAGLADAQIHDLRRQLNQSTADAGTAARNDLLQRILFRLTNLCQCLSNPDAQVRERTVQSLTELLDSAAAYNLTADATITRLVADCRANLTLAAETLRDNDALRTRTAAAARVILTTAARRVA